MREPSEDVRLAFGEGQMTRSGEVEPDRLVQRCLHYSTFCPSEQKQDSKWLLR